MAIFTVNSYTDALTGTSGNDTFYLPDLGLFGSSPVGLSFFTGSISGGTGFDTLRLLQSTNPITGFPDGPTTIHFLFSPLTSVERIEFASTPGHVLSAAIAYDAFNSAIPSTTRFVGGAGRDKMVIQAFGAGDYVMPDLNLSRFSSGGGVFDRGDYVALIAYDPGDHVLTARDNLAAIQYLSGGIGLDILNGSNGVDRLAITAGGDSAFGNAGNDFIELQVLGNPAVGMQNGGQFSGGVLDGGDGSDTLVIGGHISFTGGTITGIEKILLLPAQDYVLDPLFGEISGRLVAHFTVDSSELGSAPKLQIDGPGMVTINVTPDIVARTMQFDGSQITVTKAAETAIIINGTGGDDRITGTTGRNTINGGDGNDTLTGGARNDSLRGDGGDDQLSGGGGADQLLGKDGNDHIVGGVGADNSVGGYGADTFVFQTVAESTVALGGRDTIWDFSPAQGDQIDLHQLGLNASVSLTLGGSAFTHHAGELIQTVSGLDTVLQGDLDGNGKADFAILLKSLAGPLVLGDLVL